MKSDAFFRVISPLMLMENFVLLGISTVDGENNYYSKLMDLMNEKGGRLFKVLQLMMTCAGCRQRGRTSCDHMKHLIPNFRGIQRMEKVKAVMAVNPELYEREVMGVNVTNTVYLFNAYSIEAFFKRPLYRFDREQDVVYVGIDPSAGGHSKFTISSIANVNGHGVILGLDTSSSKRDSVVFEMMLSHIRAIRKNRWYSKAMIVVFMEANHSWYSPDRLQEAIKNDPALQPVLVYGLNGRPGVVTTHLNKVVYATHIQELLDGQRLHFTDPLICTHSAANGGQKSIQAVKKELKEQLQRFRKEYITPKTGTADPKFIVTGKLPGYTDDLVLALCISFYWMRIIQNDTAFLEMVQRNKWII